MNKAISYIRFSSSIQKQGTSLKRQTDMVNEWLLANPKVNLSPLQYKDLGRSGFHGDHLKHQFGQMLQAIEAGLITDGDFILVEAIDRIGRLPTLQALNIISSICMKGVKIITLEDGNEYSEKAIADNAGIIYYLIGKIDMAHQYSKRLSFRVEKAWDNKRTLAESGVNINRKSFWYITKDEDGKYTKITEEDRALVNEVYTKINNNESLYSVVNYLKEVQPERFKSYSSTALKKLLVNNTAIGFWGDIPNVYPKIVDETLFYSVQQELKRRNKHSKQGMSSGHIMAGLVECGECGKNLTVRNQKHTSTTMNCGNRDCSNNKSIPIAIYNEFRLATQATAIRNILEANNNVDMSKELLVLDGKIDDLATNIENLMDMAMGGSKAAQERTIKLEAERDILELKRVEITNIEVVNPVFTNLKLTGLNLANDSKNFNQMLKQAGYKIIQSGSIIKSDNLSLEYVKWNPKGYIVKIHGIEEIYPLKSDDLAREEKVAKVLLT